ncbi:TVP38/TMEM64 family protein [Acetobacter musti]|uniref:TVP38/TMEM64 family membrane protein n=1 Tax=Acetobacter musti TaxID=864732 RepID=A0ABX0JN72_9PROT|nr:VTT domain-containing protein [Acetobacter musti]NHN83946.1 TVP38/TMEM64 family protein [Acetobacter musti]
MHKASDLNARHGSQAGRGETDPDHEAGRPALLATLIRPALMLLLLTAGAVLFRETPALRHVLDNTGTLRHGLTGRLLFCLAGTVWCLFGLPRQILCFAAGLTYGFWEGSFLATLATTAGSMSCYGWARWGGRAWATRRLEGSEATPEARRGIKARLFRMKRTLRHHPFASVITLRLLPVGSSLLLNLFAGLSGIAAMPFAMATLIGSLPQTMIFVLLGSGAKIDGTDRILVAIVLFAVSGALGLWLLRRTAPELTPAPSGTGLIRPSS